jgi:RNA polymerase sigma factor (sigma-70 family)
MGISMESLSTPELIDERGRPLDVRIQRALHALRSRLRKRFPGLDDDTAVTEVLEQTGRRIGDHEKTKGPVDNLRAYAWVIARNIARSRMRRAASRLARATLASEASQAVFDELPSNVGTPEQIEADILQREVFAHLTNSERWMLGQRYLGFSSREIARQMGTTEDNVNTLFYRLRRKLTNVLGRRVPR